MAKLDLRSFGTSYVVRTSSPDLYEYVIFLMIRQLNDTVYVRDTWEPADDDIKEHFVEE
jgi:hypothetical protein